jgi:hypothetical protein
MRVAATGSFSTISWTFWFRHQNRIRVASVDLAVRWIAVDIVKPTGENRSISVASTPSYCRSVSVKFAASRKTSPLGRAWMLIQGPLRQLVLSRQEITCLLCYCYRESFACSMGTATRTRVNQARDLADPLTIPSRCCLLFQRKSTCCLGSQGNLLFTVFCDAWTSCFFLCSEESAGITLICNTWNDGSCQPNFLHG